MTEAQFEMTPEVQQQVDNFNRLLAECRAGKAHLPGAELTYMVEDLNFAYVMLPSELTFDAPEGTAILLDNEEYQGFWLQVGHHLVEKTRESVGRSEFNNFGSPYHKLQNVTRYGVNGFCLEDLGVDASEQREWQNQALMSDDVRLGF